MPIPPAKPIVNMMATRTMVGLIAERDLSRLRVISLLFDSGIVNNQVSCSRCGTVPAHTVLSARSD